MASIRDVAKLAGVSPSTVSRALSQKIYVEEETRKRVMDAVRELDYKPSLAARSLKDKGSRLLGLVIPDIQNPYYPKIVKYIEECAGSKGYAVILCDTFEDKKKESEFFETLEKLFVDGILFLPSTEDTNHIVPYVGQIPMVIVNRKFDIGLTCVLGDDYAGGSEVGTYLLEQGHKRIVCMINDKKRQYNPERLDGFCRALREHGEEDTEYDVVKDVKSVEDACQRMTEILTRPDRPSAVFAFNDNLVSGIYHAAYELGIKIPEELSVVGYDDALSSQYMVPPLTTYEHPAREIAQMALNLLVQEIQEKGNGGGQICRIAGKLQVRKSAAPPKK